MQNNTPQPPENVESVMMNWHDAEGGLYVPSEEYDDFIKDIIALMESSYAKGRSSMHRDIEAVVPKMRSVGGDTMDNDECERRWGHNDCRSQLLANIKEVLVER